MSDRNLEHLYPAFREKIDLVARDMALYAAKNMVGYKWVMVEGFRTAKYQFSLWKKRPKVTNCDGYVRKSNHQSSLAVDFAPFHGHEFDWTGKKEWWEYLGHCARKHGLAWGGDWKNPDRPHIEWPPSDKKTYADARKWQKQVGLR